MTNKVVFELCVKRAESKADEATSLAEAVPFHTNVGVILYANKRIKELEARMAIMERIIDEEWGDCDAKVAHEIKMNRS